MVPQIKPMNWTILHLFFFIIFVVYMMNMYFILNKQNDK